MNKKDLSAVLLASVLGSAAFVAPVLSEETNVDPQQETTTVDDTNVVDETETVTPVEEETPVVTNQFQTLDGSTYYFDNNGNKVTGIQTIASDVYYFDGIGVLQTSVEYEGYYFGANGKAVKNDWVQFSEGYKYYDENGQVVKGTSTSPVMKEIDGNSYAFDLNGYMLTGWQEVDGTKYYFAENGVRNDTYKVASDAATVSFTGGTWVQENGLWKYRLDSGDYAVNTVMLIRQYYYAFDYSGYMLRDATFRVNSGPFSSGYIHADKNGRLIKGWYKKYDGNYEYFGSDYFAYTDGLHTIGNKQYYFVNTTMVASQQFVYNDSLYEADKSGACTVLDTMYKTGWVKTFEGWYYFLDGGVVRDRFEVIDSNKYYFSYDGKMKCDEVFAEDNMHYYANKNGFIIEKKNAWYKNTQGDWLYFLEDGDLAINQFYPIGNDTYLFDENGILQKGVVNHYGKSYLTDKSGAVLVNKGWKKVDGQWRYVQDDGTLLFNSLFEDGLKVYYVNEYGIMVANQVKLIDGNYYVFDVNGVLTKTIPSFNGWKKIQNVWYYGKNGNMTYTGRVGNNYVSDGKMLTNTIVGAYGKTQYYVDYNGKIQKGWIQSAFGWYYADMNTGKLARNEWKKINGKWYYFGYSMAQGYYTIDGELNRFANDGEWLGVVKPNSWIKDSYSDHWLYITANGTFNMNSRIKINGVTYYFKSEGKGSTVGLPYLVENGAWYDAQEGAWRWTNKTGTGLNLTEGWKKSTDGQFGYVRNGKLLTGLQTINGKTYYFDNYGYLFLGGTNQNGKAIVCDSKGNLVNYKEGWNELEGQWFYIQNNKILTNTVIDGYYVGYNGLTFTGVLSTVTMYNDAHVLVKQGQIARNQWIKDYEEWYYADANGHKVRNQWIGNYYVDAYGRMVKNTWIGNYHVGADGKWDMTR